MVKEKKEFSWDNEVVLKEIVESEYQKRVVSVTELKGKQFVCVATHKKIKGDWKPIKNATFPIDVWEQVGDAVTDFKLGNAFGSATKLEAPKKVKKEEPATIKGKKSSIQSKLEKNANFGSLSKEKQKELIEKVEMLHLEDGMVSVAVSKTNFYVSSGMPQIQAEKFVKQQKGFSRAQITFIP